MALSLTCHNKDCGAVMTAESVDDLVELGQRHAREHGHAHPPPREHLLPRIRRQNPAGGDKR